jgi:hypothetical protein
MKRILAVLILSLGLGALAVACSDTTGSTPSRTAARGELHVPGPDLAATWTPKYNVVTCQTAVGQTAAAALGVNEMILHGEVWEGFASNGWLQWERNPTLESQPERTAEVELYSFYFQPGGQTPIRCRNQSKAVKWGFYDGPSQTPRNTNISNTTGLAPYFTPSAFTNPGDGIVSLTNDGHWEIGRDHYIAATYPRQSSNGFDIADSLKDTLAVDAVITWPAGCPPDQFESPSCRP